MSVFGVWFVLGMVGIILFGLFLFSLFSFISIPVAGLFYGAPWVRTRKKVIQGMIDLAEIREGETVMDIGCGDGAILFEVLKRYPSARVIGIDCNPFLIWSCRLRAWIQRDGHRARFLREDLRTGMIPKADVVMLYLLPPLMEQLRPRLKEFLDSETRIVSHAFRFASVFSRDGSGSTSPISLYLLKDL